MKRIIQLIVLISLISCQNTVKQSEQDKLEDKTNVDISEDSRKAQTPPESIFDFIWKFSGDSSFQKTRIDFPLALGDSTINKSEWQHDRQFIDLPYTFYLFKGHDYRFGYNQDFGDNAIISWIYPKDSLKLDYIFNRIDNLWRLTDLKAEMLGLDENEIPFYISQFFYDSVFQKSHIKYPLELNTWIGDEIDSKDTTFLIERNELNLIQRYKGEPRFPLFRLDNANLDTYGSMFTILLGGNDNGYHIEYFFEKLDNEWILTRLDDDSN
jgi:hypothetical protein